MRSRARTACWSVDDRPKLTPFQFDWSCEYAVIGGLRKRLEVAHIKLAASRAFWLVAYLTQSHEMLFDAHARGFAAFGGIPRRGIYNMKTAVDRVGEGKERTINARFARQEKSWSERGHFTGRDIGHPVLKEQLIKLTTRSCVLSWRKLLACCCRQVPPTRRRRPDVQTETSRKTSALRRSTKPGSTLLPP